MRGRDPLGVNAVNVHLYGTLVPGITNATNRLRYYSFYPWTLKLYKDKNIQLDFIPFLRRAEFLFCIITNQHHAGETSRSVHMDGSDTIKYVTDELNEKKQIKLSKYTSLEEGPHRYLKNKLGGFGQNYLGPLFAMQILVRKNNLDFDLYPRGEKLGNAFNAGSSKEKFVSCILNDNLTIEELDEMKEDLCACNIRRNSKEYDLLVCYLMGRDDPSFEDSTYMRRNTLALIFMLLNQIGKPAGYWELLNFLYYSKSENNKTIEIPCSLSETANLWKYYVQHEFFSMSLMSIFISVQHLLDENPLDSLAIYNDAWEKLVLNSRGENLPKSLKICLKRLKKTPSLNEFLEYMHSVYNAEEAWDKNALSEISISNFLNGKQSPADELFIGGFVLLCLLLNKVKDIEREPAEINLHSLFMQYPVNLKRLRADYTNKWQKEKVSKVAGDLIVGYVLNQHMNIAIRKLYTEGLATFRCLWEDGLFRHSEINFDSVAKTNPRLRQSLQMLSDLGIVEENRNGFLITEIDIGNKYFGNLIYGN